MIRLILVSLISMSCHFLGSAVAKPNTKMPKEFIRCKRDDPKINSCLQNAIQKALPILAKGLPKLGIIPIDPMLTTRATMEQRFGPVNLLVDFTNFTVAGYEKGKITKARADVEKYKVGADMFLKKVEIHGRYDVDGKVFILPLRGDGTFKIIFENVNAVLNIVGEENMKNGTRYMKVKRFDVGLDPKGLSFELENLFGGNKFLGDRANEFLNEHSIEVFREMRGTVEATIGLIFKELSQRFYAKVPYDEIYL